MAFVERGIKLLREGTPVLDPELVPEVSTGIPMLTEEYGPVVHAPDFESRWTPFESRPYYFAPVRGDSMGKLGLRTGNVVSVETLIGQGFSPVAATPPKRQHGLPPPGIRRLMAALCPVPYPALP